VLNAYSSPNWIDRYKSIPARTSRNFVPDNPRESRASVGALLGSVSILGAIIGPSAGIISRTSKPIATTSPSPQATPLVGSVEDERKLVGEMEEARQKEAFLELLEKGNDASQKRIITMRSSSTRKLRN